MELGRVFHFDDELKGKKIVIYGASVTGLKIHEGAIKEGIEVVAFVDQKAKDINWENKIPVYLPSEFSKNVQYDSIIVASSSYDTQKAIKEFLIEIGVVSEKIRILSEKLYDGEKYYYMDADADSYINQLIECDLNCENQTNLSIEASLWFNSYLDRIEDKLGLANRARYELLNNNQYRSRIVCGLLLFKTKHMTSKDFSIFMKEVLQIPEGNPDWMYLLGKIVSFFELKQESVIYESLGHDRRELWIRALKEYGLLESKHKGDNSESNHVVIWMDKLMQKEHSASNLYRGVANMLSDEDYKVTILIPLLREHQGFGVFSCDSCQEEQDCYDLYRELNRKWISSNINIEYICENSYKELLESTAKKTIEYTPSVIIDMLDDTNPVSWMFENQVPILYIPARNCTSSTWYTKTSLRVSAHNYKEIGERNIELGRFPITSEAKGVYSREEYLNIGEKEFVVVTVGNRLFTEMTDSFVEKMLECLQNCRNMHWILVGDGKRLRKWLIKYKEESSYQKIRFIDYEEDLVALYRLCDVFLNPIRCGGGFSIAQAMEQGVAIVSLKSKKSVAADAWMENRTVEGTEQNLFEYLEKLYNDPQLLSKQKKYAKNVRKKLNSEAEFSRNLIRFVHNVKRERGD